MTKTKGEHFIHSWYRNTFSQALIYSVIVEGISIAPLAVWGMGHAGPNGPLAWLSLLFNFFGFIFAFVLISIGFDMTWTAVIVVVFFFQTLVWCFIIFVYLRWRKTRRSDQRRSPTNR